MQKSFMAESYNFCGLLCSNGMLLRVYMAVGFIGVQSNRNSSGLNFNSYQFTRKAFEIGRLLCNDSYCTGGWSMETGNGKIKTCMGESRKHQIKLLYCVL